MTPPEGGLIQDSVSGVRSVALNSAATFFLGLMLGDKLRAAGLSATSHEGLASGAAVGS